MAMHYYNIIIYAHAHRVLKCQNYIFDSNERYNVIL